MRAALNEAMAVDHTAPAFTIIRPHGIGTLTREQMTDLLQDRIGLGNLQPLPQSRVQGWAKGKTRPQRLADSMPAGIVEFKDVRELSKDLQFQLYEQSQKRIDLVVSPKTEYISGPLAETIRGSGGSISIYNPRSGLFHPYDFESGMFLITRPK